MTAYMLMIPVIFDSSAHYPASGGGYHGVWHTGGAASGGILGDSVAEIGGTLGRVLRGTQRTERPHAFYRGVGWGGGIRGVYSHSCHSRRSICFVIATNGGSSRRLPWYGGCHPCGVGRGRGHAKDREGLSLPRQSAREHPGRRRELLA